MIGMEAKGVLSAVIPLALMLATFPACQKKAVVSAPASPGQDATDLSPRHIPLLDAGAVGQAGQSAWLPSRGDPQVLQRKQQLRRRVYGSLGDIGRCITEAPGDPKWVIESMPHTPIKATAGAGGAVKIDVQNPPPGTQSCLDKLVANWKVPPGPVVTLTIRHVCPAGQEPE